MFIKRTPTKFIASQTAKDDEELEVLPPGKYEFHVEGGIFASVPTFNAIPFRAGLIEIKGRPFSDVKNTLHNFFTKETAQIYSDIQINHFIGLILYGPPGTGKTCLVDNIAKTFAETHQAITIYINDRSDILKLKALVNLARKNANQMVIITIEELDKFLISGWAGNEIEKALIEFCDGSDTPTNVLFIVTTNHINKIPDSLKKRDSRFAIKALISGIPTEVIEQLVDKFLPKQYEDVINKKELIYEVGNIFILLVS